MTSLKIKLLWHFQYSTLQSMVIVGILLNIFHWRIITLQKLLEYYILPGDIDQYSCNNVNVDIQVSAHDAFLE